jgi:hypothetical protein
MLKDKIDWNSEEKIQFCWISCHCSVEVNERADLEAKQAIKEGRDSQLLLLPVVDLKTQWEKEGAKKSLTASIKTPNVTRGESYFERYCSSGLSPWLPQIKMNCYVFVSINHMRAGHNNLKASLNIFNMCPRPNVMVVMSCKWRNIWDCKR